MSFRSSVHPFSRRAGALFFAKGKSCYSLRTKVVAQDYIDQARACIYNIDLKGILQKHIQSNFVTLMHMRDRMTNNNDI